MSKNWNSNDNVFKVLKNKKAQKLKLPEQPKKQSLPWWATLLINIGFGLLSFVVELTATAILGPVGGMIVGVVTDIGTNIIGDVVTGNDPFSPENIIFNLVVPLVQLPGNIKRAKGLDVNKVSRLGAIADDVKLKKLSNELSEIDINDVDFAKTGKRKYQQILGQLDDVDLKQKIKWKDTLDFGENQKNWRKKVNYFNKSVRQFNKLINFLDPSYATSELVNFITRPIKKFINKKISSFFRKINTKFFKKFKRTLKEQMIPLHHTSTLGWVKGVKLLPIPKTINYYHVIIYFNPKTTNKKLPVKLRNKKWSYIQKFINAKSAGRYYINNISWGWEIGKFIRTNNKELDKVKRIVNKFTYVAQGIRDSFMLIDSIATAIDKLIHFDKVIQDWSNPNKPITGLVQGLSSQLKGVGLIKPIVRSAQTGSYNPILSYTSRFISKQTRKYIKKIKPITNKRTDYYKSIFKN